MKDLADCRLYGILDLGYVALSDISGMARDMIAGGVDVMQLRAKDHPPEDILAMGREILPITRDGGIPFIINDHPEVAADLGSDGVHVGQDDLSMAGVRRIVGEDMLVGRSTHSLEQAHGGAAEEADYIGFGPLFATPTKPDYRPIGTSDIAAVHREYSDLPIFCIGGIKLENLPQVLAAGARRVVIVSGILRAPDVVAYIRQAKSLLE